MWCVVFPSVPRGRQRAAQRRGLGSARDKLHAGWSCAGRSWRWHGPWVAIRPSTDERRAQTRGASKRVRGLLRVAPPRRSSAIREWRTRASTFIAGGHGGAPPTWNETFRMLGEAHEHVTRSAPGAGGPLGEATGGGPAILRPARGLHQALQLGASLERPAAMIGTSFWYTARSTFTTKAHSSRRAIVRAASENSVVRPGHGIRSPCGSAQSPCREYAFHAPAMEVQSLQW